MQEEVENRTVAIVTSAAKFTGRLFKAAICKYLEHRKLSKANKARASPVIPHGKQTVKQLIGQNQGDCSASEAARSSAFRFSLCSKIRSGRAQRRSSWCSQCCRSFCLRCLRETVSRSKRS